MTGLLMGRRKSSFFLKKLSTLPPLPRDEEKESFIQENFNGIARYYDLFNDLFTFRMHRLWKKKLINNLQIDKAGEAIDLCCGSGDIAILMAKHPRAKPEIKIHAVDFSEEMLHVLRQRLRRFHLEDKIKVENHNVLYLPDSFSQKFDVATVGYGVRNVRDRLLFFKEVYRILKPDGRFGILEVGNIKPGFLQPVANMYMKTIIPLIGFFLQKERLAMYQYLPASTLVFPPPETIIAELREAGFRNIKTIRLFFGASMIYIAHK